MIEQFSEFKLCYAVNEWAYFTTRKLEEQRGDDWDDAPYEHNAGSPYCYDKNDQERGYDPWGIKRVGYSGPFELPCDGYQNSPYTVEMINAGAAAWLRTDQWTKPSVNIPAGTTLPEFIRLVHSVDGEVYLPAKDLL